MESPVSSSSPPPTLAPEIHQSHPRSNAPPSDPEASENAPASAALTTELGSLHLKPWSLEDFFDISTYKYGLYEYVEGILVALPSLEKIHDNIIQYLLNHCTVRYVKEEVKNVPRLQRSLAIPCSSPRPGSPPPRTIRTPDLCTAAPLSPSQTNQLSPISRRMTTPGSPPPRRTIRRPDLCTAAPLSPSQRNQLSPISRRITFPFGPIETVVEVTSVNEKTDTELKVEEYNRAQVQKLILIVRDVNCTDESKKDERIEIRERDPTTNSWGPTQVFRGDTPVDMGPYGILKPSTIFGDLDPLSPLKDLSKQMKELVETTRKNEEIQAELLKEIRELKRENEALRAQAKAVAGRKRHYKNILREKVPDETMSPSSGSASSETASPDRKKSRLQD